MKGEAIGNRQQATGRDHLRCCVSSAVFSLFRALVFAFVLMAVALTAYANPYDDGMRRVRLLSESPNVRLLPFGRSPLGRPIPAYIVSDFSVDSTKKTRVLVIAGQHGDEYNPVRSILALSWNLAAGSRTDLTRNCLILTIPMANPDGIALGMRLNSQGKDINRDWLDRSSPEAKYVHSIIKTWRPQAIIDAHEWTGPSPTPANGIELPLSYRRQQYQAMGSVAQGIARNAGLSLIRDTNNSDGRLFHRRYSALGYASYLIETAPGENYAAKSNAYTTAVEWTAGSLASSAKLRSAVSPASSAFNPTAVGSYLEPIRTGPFADAQATTLGLAAAAVAVYCLMVWVMRPLASKTETTWSHRYRKCSVDCDTLPHPLLKKRHLQPLTSRSWTHRRLRARYARAESEMPIHNTGMGSLTPSLTR